MAEDHVAPRDPSKRTSPIVASRDAEADFAGEDFALGDDPPGHASCMWNDKKYSDGATICDSGQRRECWNGRWVDIGNC